MAIDRRWKWSWFILVLTVVFLAGCAGRWAGDPEDRSGLAGDDQAGEPAEQEDTAEPAGQEDTAEPAGKEGAAKPAGPKDTAEETGQETAERLAVATTIFPYYDFVRQIAGDKVKLRLVVPAGMDSHSFEPTPADMIHIQESDLLLYNGGEMERWVKEVLESVGESRMRVVCMMDSVDVLEEEVVEGMEDDPHGHHDHAGHEDEDHAGYAPGQLHEIEYDEHIWTSPVNAIKIVERIGQVLAEEDPENAAFYGERTEAYIEELKGLDRRFRQVVADGRWDMIIVGDRFPFRYLVETYGLQYRAAFAGCSGDTEPSARTIAYLIGQVKERQLPAVFYLELSSHRVAQIIGEETGARTLLLHSCHNVTRREFEEGVTYLQLMEQNVEALRIGLGAG